MNNLTVKQLKQAINKKGVKVYTSAKLFNSDCINVEVKKVDILQQLNRMIAGGYGDDKTEASLYDDGDVLI